MQIVIDIPEGLKKDFESEQWTALSCMEMKDALMNGTPLPKGHGDLIDRNEARDAMRYTMSGTGYQSMAMDVLNEFYTPTIIESDKEG